MAATNNSDAKPDLKNGPIVHVRADSDSDLDNLFSVVNPRPGMQMPLSIPWKMKKLPPSFFNEPSLGSKSPGCHSRDNSVDNTLRDVNSPASNQSSSSNVGSPQPAQNGPPPTQPAAPFHSRAHSSPATLQQTLAVAQANQKRQQQHLHLRQPSYDPCHTLAAIRSVPCRPAGRCRRPPTASSTS